MTGIVTKSHSTETSFPSRTGLLPGAVPLPAQVRRTVFPVFTRSEHRLLKSGSTCRTIA